MSIIQVASHLTYQVESPASFIFTVAVAQNTHQTIQQEQLIINPLVPYEGFMSGEEANRSIRFALQPCTLTLDYTATIELSHTIHQPPQLDEVAYLNLPTDALPYLNPSRYCESDRLGRFAYKTFGHLPMGYARVSAICDWVFNHIDYVSGSTHASSSACDVLVQGAGVCRDFAHLSIALCRALGIPARYVAGYAPELQPPDFHGFFEAYLGGNWYLFDATKLAPVGGFVRISAGRDAADTAFANIVGNVSLEKMEVSAVSLTQNAPSPNSAVSTA